MEFACVRDCSRCPFSGMHQNRRRQSVSQTALQGTSMDLPEVLQSSLEGKEESVPSSRIESVVQDCTEVAAVNQNEVAVADVEFEVHDAKRTLFGWRKK